MPAGAARLACNCMHDVLNFWRDMRKTCSVSRDVVESALSWGVHRLASRLQMIAGSPELYPEVVRLGAMPPILALLSHDNSDIAASALELLRELTDSDVVEDSVRAPLGQPDEGVTRMCPISLVGLWWRPFGVLLMGRVLQRVLPEGMVLWGLWLLFILGRGGTKAMESIDSPTCRGVTLAGDIAFQDLHGFSCLHDAACTAHSAVGDGAGVKSCGVHCAWGVEGVCRRRRRASWWARWWRRRRWSRSRSA